MYCKDNDELLVEHFRLQKDINDIQSQIRKLEKTNQLLDQQNQNLKLELESKNIKQTQIESSNSGITRLLDRAYLVKTLNKASEICEVATGEIIKHARYVTNNIISNLNTVNTLDTSMLDNMNSRLVSSVNTNVLSDTNRTLVNTVDTSMFDIVNTNPIGSTNDKVAVLKNNILNNINTHRQDTCRESTAKERLFSVESFIDSEKTNSILDSTIISNLSSNESLMLSDEECTQVHHTGQYQ
ncbi:hypothetical protein MACJ_002477 [Theileria orientalis]|uniref:Uncharacterized protein n=1 Tax=Theileria orientalis TaxID=68886 RepID=A0A976QRE1_THEOR|nr:hypothetical protein MACJ_002477 [Theileria orientalis]